VDVLLGCEVYVCVSVEQLMQQQAAIMAAAAQGGSPYLSPMTALAAAQVQHPNVLVPNGLTTGAITPTTTGEEGRGTEGGEEGGIIGW